jgi:hypothetical protein
LSRLVQDDELGVGEFHGMWLLQPEATKIATFYELEPAINAGWSA